MSNSIYGYAPPKRLVGGHSSGGRPLGGLIPGNAGETERPDLATLTGWFTRHTPKSRPGACKGGPQRRIVPHNDYGSMDYVCGCGSAPARRRSCSPRQERGRKSVHAGGPCSAGAALGRAAYFAADVSAEVYSAAAPRYPRGCEQECNQPASQIQKRSPHASRVPGPCRDRGRGTD